jgi:hypothetical protein
MLQSRVGLLSTSLGALPSDNRLGTRAPAFLAPFRALERPFKLALLSDIHQGCWHSAAISAHSPPARAMQPTEDAAPRRPGQPHGFSKLSAGTKKLAAKLGLKSKRDRSRGGSPTHPGSTASAGTGGSSPAPASPLGAAVPGLSPVSPGFFEEEAVPVAAPMAPATPAGHLEPEQQLGTPRVPARVAVASPLEEGIASHVFRAPDSPRSPARWAIVSCMTAIVLLGEAAQAASRQLRPLPGSPAGTVGKASWPPTGSAWPACVPPPSTPPTRMLHQAEPLPARGQLGRQLP